MKNSSRQLFSRLTVYVIVFVLVAVSYINFTNNRDNNLKTDSDVTTLDTTKAVESPDEINIKELDEEMVLGEIDIEDLQEIEEES